MEVCRRGRRTDDAVRRSRTHEASNRYGRHVSGTPLTDTTTHAVDRGARHGRARRIPASSGVRSRLPRLHGRHAAATFSQLCGPPFERGTTWSIESARSPQYWQRKSSRAKIARRDSAARRTYGTLTMYRRRITDGLGTLSRSEWMTRPSSSRTSAFSAITRHVARWVETMLSGSKLAFSTSALSTALSPFVR